MHDIMMIGHVSKDIIEDPEGVQHVFGGPVIYSSASATRTGASVHVVTKASREDQEKLSILHECGATVTVRESPETTSIHNLYETSDHERRTVTLLSSATPFTLDEIPEDTVKIYHLAGLFVGEIPETLIKDLAGRAPVAIDAQGVVRFSREGDMIFRDWEAKKEYLPHVQFLKTDAAEAELLTGTSDRDAAADKLLEMGAREVMITHNTEVLIAARDGERFRSPLNPRNLSGRTGRGDTCFAAYLARQLTHPRKEALAYAAALVSIKMEAPGVFRGTVQDVLDRMV
ncbi:Sugar or nucleoside kinase, ribokinase family [Alkalispirochaeta americana]|uniref:Sugar or nucleoside kinase, ribokinase family n=1 Tax=Alkalispirochaeta americana TaxID=159291 RepID=A0A1N6XP40_9SPIO|nr:PfkB family carbohydrate kinase [Alkalispirochaeta americana]SIR03979.1 Sugar or nucleoside kinase, ribokinase family [Alkalispirochaeta americana]